MEPERRQARCLDGCLEYASDVSGLKGEYPFKGFDSIRHKTAQKALRDYSHASFALAKLLQRRAGLTDLEQLMIDNNLAIVQLNYAAWMRKSNESNPFPEAC